jgi:hypothetical protein
VTHPLLPMSQSVIAHIHLSSPSSTLLPPPRLITLLVTHPTASSIISVAFVIFVPRSSCSSFTHRLLWLTLLLCSSLSLLALFYLLRLVSISFSVAFDTHHLLSSLLARPLPIAFDGAPSSSAPPFLF